MKTTGTAHTIPDSANLTSELLREIGRGILASIDPSSPIHEESPPEAVLGALLRFATGAAVPAAPIEILARQRVSLPGEPTIVVEPDLTIRCTEPEATAVVEVEGWRWHRRTRQEQDYETRRGRLILRHYRHLLPYSATEVLRDPWGVLIEIFDHLRCCDGFEGVEMSAAARAVAEACRTNTVPLTRGERPARLHGCALDRLRRAAARLPAVTDTWDAEVRRAREEHPRLYALG